MKANKRFETLLTFVHDIKEEKNTKFARIRRGHS